MYIHTYIHTYIYIYIYIHTIQIYISGVCQTMFCVKPLHDQFVQPFSCYCRTRMSSLAVTVVCVQPFHSQFVQCLVCSKPSQILVPLFESLDSRGSHPCAGAMRIAPGLFIRLETLLELKLINWTCSSLDFSILVFRAYPLVEITQAAHCRAIRGKSSDWRQQYLSQQYPPPLLEYRQY